MNWFRKNKISSVTEKLAILEYELNQLSKRIEQTHALVINPKLLDRYHWQIKTKERTYEGNYPTKEAVEWAKFVLNTTNDIEAQSALSVVINYRDFKKE